MHWKCFLFFLFSSLLFFRKFRKFRFSSFPQEMMGRRRQQWHGWMKSNRRTEEETKTTKKKKKKKRKSEWERETSREKRKSSQTKNEGIIRIIMHLRRERENDRSDQWWRIESNRIEGMECIDSAISKKKNAETKKRKGKKKSKQTQTKSIPPWTEWMKGWKRKTKEEQNEKKNASLFSMPSLIFMHTGQTEGKTWNHPFFLSLFSCDHHSSIDSWFHWFCFFFFSCHRYFSISFHVFFHSFVFPFFLFCFWQDGWMDKRFHQSPSLSRRKNSTRSAEPEFDWGVKPKSLVICDASMFRIQEREEEKNEWVNEWIM